MAATHLCVFCGSAPGGHPDYRRAAEELGAALAPAGLGLVYGGGREGLMGALADAALAHGVEVVGVIPQRLHDAELGHPGLHELLVVDGMAERKAAMAARARAFAVLPGGFGTLEEMFEAVSWAQLGYHDKPVGLLNTRGYFDRLLAFLEHAANEAFVRPEHRPLLNTAPCVPSLLRSLAIAPATEPLSA